MKTPNKDLWFNYPKFYNYIASLPDISKLVEVGCWKGHSVIHLAKKMIESTRPFQLWAVDIWQDNLETYLKNVEEAGVRNRIVDLRKHSVEAAATFKAGSLDFVFLDADHRPQAVTADIKAWLPKIRPGGILAGHDYYLQTLGYAWGSDDNVSEAVTKAVKQNIIPQPHINTNTSVWMVRLPE